MHDSEHEGDVKEIKHTSGQHQPRSPSTEPFLYLGHTNKGPELDSTSLGTTNTGPTQTADGWPVLSTTSSVSRGIKQKKQVHFMSRLWLQPEQRGHDAHNLETLLTANPYTKIADENFNDGSGPLCVDSFTAVNKEVAAELQIKGGKNEVEPSPTPTAAATRKPAQDADAGSGSSNVDASSTVNEQVHDSLEQERQVSVFS